MVSSKDIIVEVQTMDGKRYSESDYYRSGQSTEVTIMPKANERFRVCVSVGSEWSNNYCGVMVLLDIDGLKVRDWVYLIPFGTANPVSVIFEQTPRFVWGLRPRWRQAHFVFEKLEGGRKRSLLHAQKVES